MRNAVTSWKAISTLTFFILWARFYELKAEAHISTEAHTAKAPSITEQRQPKELILGLGHYLEIPTRTSGPIRIVNGDHVKITDQKNHLKIFGRSLGYTLIHTGQDTFRIQILRDAQYRCYLRIRQLASLQEGLQINYRNQQLVISGQLKSFASWRTLAREVSDHIKIAFTAKIPPLVQADAELFFSKLQKESWLTAKKIQWLDSPTLFVSPKTTDEFSRYQKLFAPYGIQVHKGDAKTEAKVLVKIHLYFTEVKESAFQRLGIQWPNQFSAQMLPSENIDTPLSLQLQALEQTGDGHIIASPTLVVESGKEAEFFSGGEIPIKHLEKRRQSVQWKRYGLSFQIRPLVAPDGALHLTLASEISNLDMSQSIDGIPALSTHKLSTEIQMQIPHSLFVSGLHRKETGGQVEGLNFLSRIPILGRLFSVQDQRWQKTQVIVFVDPEIIGNGNDL
jgi:hypothetical protein